MVSENVTPPWTIYIIWYTTWKRNLTHKVHELLLFRHGKSVWLDWSGYLFVLFSEKSESGRIIPLIRNILQAREISNTRNDIWGILFNPSNGFPHGGFFNHLRYLSFFSRKTKQKKYADDNTSLCSSSESIKSSDTPEDFCRKWRLVNNDP